MAVVTHSVKCQKIEQSIEIINTKRNKSYGEIKASTVEKVYKMLVKKIKSANITPEIIAEELFNKLYWLKQ